MFSRTFFIVFFHYLPDVLSLEIINKVLIFELNCKLSYHYSNLCLTLGHHQVMCLVDSVQCKFIPFMVWISKSLVLSQMIYDLTKFQ